MSEELRVQRLPLRAQDADDTPSDTATYLTAPVENILTEAWLAGDAKVCDCGCGKLFGVGWVLHADGVFSGCVLDADSAFAGCVPQDGSALIGDDVIKGCVLQADSAFIGGAIQDDTVFTPCKVGICCCVCTTNCLVGIFGNAVVWGKPCCGTPRLFWYVEHDSWLPELA